MQTNKFLPDVNQLRTFLKTNNSKAGGLVKKIKCFNTLDRNPLGLSNTINFFLWQVAAGLSFTQTAGKRFQIFVSAVGSESEQ